MKDAYIELRDSGTTKHHIELTICLLEENLKIEKSLDLIHELFLAKLALVLYEFYET